MTHSHSPTIPRIEEKKEKTPEIQPEHRPIGGSTPSVLPRLMQLQDEDDRKRYQEDKLVQGLHNAVSELSQENIFLLNKCIEKGKRISELVEQLAGHKETLQKNLELASLNLQLTRENQALREQLAKSEVVPSSLQRYSMMNRERIAPPTPVAVDNHADIVSLNENDDETFGLPFLQQSS